MRWTPLITPLASYLSALLTTLWLMGPLSGSHLLIFTVGFISVWGVLSSVFPRRPRSRPGNGPR